MKQFLLAALLGTISFGADALTTGNGKRPHQHNRTYAPYRHRMEFMGPGGHGWRHHYHHTVQEKQLQQGEPLRPGSSETRPDRRDSFGRQPQKDERTVGQQDGTQPEPRDNQR